MSRRFSPRHAQTAGNLGLAMQFIAETRTAPLSSGRIVPGVTIGRVTIFIQRERSNVKHSITGYLSLPQPTPVRVLMRELHWLWC